MDALSACSALIAGASAGERKHFLRLEDRWRERLDALNRSPTTHPQLTRPTHDQRSLDEPD